MRVRIWAKQALVGLSRFELLTPRLSSVCSNQLSYRPLSRHRTDPAGSLKTRQNVTSMKPVCVTYQIDLEIVSDRNPKRSRKEVIQPQVLLQLPCYDFTPITDHTLGASLPCGLVWRLLVQPAFVM